MFKTTHVFSQIHITNLILRIYTTHKILFAIDAADKSGKAFRVSPNSIPNC